MIITALTHEHKAEVERVVTNSWGGTSAAVHRELYDLRELPCFVALSDRRELLGYCLYRFSGRECELMALESVRPNMGVGTALIEAVKELAREKGCSRLYLQTTNDNTHALRFYQRHGFTMCAVRLNELDYSRKLNPSIPLVGDDDIPVLHEIEFEMAL